MPPANLPENETARLAALCQYNILDTPAEAAFDEIATLAAALCDTPIALVSLVDSTRQWFKAKIGLAVEETEREVAFCGHAILQPDLLIVPDASQDQRFADNPFVLDDPQIRFYAGAPLLTAEGHAMGTLCVIDSVPRDLSLEQAQALRVLARQVMTQLELRRHVKDLAQTVAQVTESERALQIAQATLESQVSDRTAALVQTNATLQVEINERLQAEKQLQQQVEHNRLLGAIAARIRESLQLDDILQTAVAEVRHFLQVDRVALYEIEVNQGGRFVVESVAPGCPSILGLVLHDHCFETDYAAQYQQGRISAIDDIEQAELSPCYREVLAPLKLRALLLVPIIFKEQLWGLLCMHHCSAPRPWQDFELSALQQLATQVAIGMQQAQLFQQVQQQAQREQLLNQISRALNASLDPNHILQEIVNQIGACFSVERVVVFALVAEQMQVLNEWRANDQVASLLHCRAPLNLWTAWLDPTSACYAPQLFQMPLLTAEQPASTEPGQQPSPSLAVLHVPINIGDQFLGGLCLHTTASQHTFTADELSLLEQIAAQAAIALCNAQSYERLEQLVQQRTQALEQEKLRSEAANRAKSEFLANMSHELRTPLNAVLGLSQMLQRELFGSLNPKQQEYVTCIHSSGNHLLLLINDILDLAKVEAGKEELALLPLSVSKLCAYCLTLVQERAFEQGLRLISHIDPRVSFCMADERRLKQILINLLSNAIKFTSVGDVSLTVQKQPQGLTFTVSDTGIGMAEAQIPLLFQPFVQLDSRLNRRYEGTGLGLALARELAQLHGGDITVESTLGQGSQFTLYLPDEPPGLKQIQPVTNLLIPSPRHTLSQRQTASSRRILVVEDDIASAMLLQDFLQALGHRVEHWADGSNFLERVQLFRPALILLDVQLPHGITGFDLLTALRQEAALYQLPVVMVTAMAMQGDRERCLAAGATDYLSKPIQTVQIESLLSQYLSVT
ncbi:GAF domain-containing protein [Phormidium sp. FACHB-592]|uniref:histidine kinase n=1 Tax=Stenomitos frigidus AS-A4 TaxID=2933935 RepID=A0ABV0KGQ3_9CYAN|nr:GAF domain-containing protein [Phormidium sp. FACHB-592]MBD2078193.1 GAF domain-containing protein [Phormidium sp. FACHB-592]